MRTIEDAALLGLPRSHEGQQNSGGGRTASAHISPEPRTPDPQQTNPKDRKPERGPGSVQPASGNSFPAFPGRPPDSHPPAAPDSLLLMFLPRRFAILAAAFLSGAGALGLQLAWTRRLAVHLGHELPAAFAVLTLFFLGLGLGSVTFGGRIQRSRQPSRWIVGLESFAALWALGTIATIGWAGERIPAWLGAEGTRHLVAAGAVTASLLLPATLALGGTFAAFERTLATAGVPRASGLVYAVNTAGAVVGVGLALAWIQPWLGLRGATAVAAGFHLLAGMAALGLSPATPGPATQTPTPLPRPQTTGRRFLAGLALSGFFAIGTEVVAIRLLTQVLGGTVYTQALVLVIWLLGTALGAALRHRHPHPHPATVAALAALGITLAGYALAASPRLLAWGMQTSGTSFAATLAWEAVVVGCVLLPVTLPGGALFTALIEGAVAEDVPSGKAVGINTLAGALAPVAWIALLFPRLGSRWTWTLLIVLALLAAAYLVVSARAGNEARPLPASSSRRRNTHAWTGLWAGLATLGLVGLAAMNLQLAQPPPGARLRRILPGAADTVAVWEWPDGNRSLSVNNRFAMGGTAAAPAAARHAHLPLLLHPSPRHALFLGLGTGISFAAAGTHPGLEAEGVELVPEVVEVLPEFEPHSRLATGLRVVTADARRFIRATPRTYDVIVADLFHPERDGAAWLYTVEHFRSLRDRLRPGGVACQWLPWFQLDEPSLQAVVRAWLEVFPDSDAWLLRWTTLDTPVVGLVWGGRVPDPDAWPERVRDPGLRDALRKCGLSDGWQLAGCWVSPATSLLPEARSPHRPGPMNRDDHPGLTWTAARGADRARLESRRALLRWIDQVPQPAPATGHPSPANQAGTRPRNPDAGENPPARPGSPPPLAVHPPVRDIGRWERLRAARDLYLHGLAADLAGDRDQARALFLRSIVASPDFPTGYSHLLAEAAGMVRVNATEARRLLEELVIARPDQPVAKEFLRRLPESGAGGSRSQE